uniref:Uncharacterized protein n=1 Tax=Acidianus sulfidivorans JP7 TaxID=619593 RepID=A0A2U9IPX0_9CREN
MRESLTLLLSDTIQINEKNQWITLHGRSRSKKRKVVIMLRYKYIISTVSFKLIRFYGENLVIN